MLLIVAEWQAQGCETLVRPSQVSVMVCKGNCSITRAAPLMWESNFATVPLPVAAADPRAARKLPVRHAAAWQTQQQAEKVELGTPQLKEMVGTLLQFPAQHPNWEKQAQLRSVSTHTHTHKGSQAPTVLAVWICHAGAAVIAAAAAAAVRCKKYHITVQSSTGGRAPGGKLCLARDSRSPCIGGYLHLLALEHSVDLG